MKWEIAENSRVDIVGYSGVNYSGDRFETRIFPSGRQGADLDGSKIRSMAILGPYYGMRVILRTTLQDDWEDQTWRVVRLLKGHTFKTEDGRYGVRIPDLDSVAPPDAFRCNPDIIESYPLKKRVADVGPDDTDTWTYGRIGRGKLQHGVVKIVVDKEG